MSKLSFRTIISLVALVFLSGCLSDKQLTEKVKEVVKKNPSIIHEAIKADPAGFMETLQKAVESAKKEMAKKREEEEKKKYEAAFDNPLKPEIRKDESFRGNKDGVITLVEYSDFECPYCNRGYQTVMGLMKKYEGKVRFLFKHLPLSFHPNAMPASAYYEAIRLQDPEKAFKFHDEIFKNQRKLQQGKPFLDKLAKKVGADMAKLKKDAESDAVKNRIKADMAEAAKFGIQGTPGFVINGIPVKGAYPQSYFEKIIKDLQDKGKLKL
jgi:protein-disulfide isomerase